MRNSVLFFLSYILFFGCQSNHSEVIYRQFRVDYPPSDSLLLDTLEIKENSLTFINGHKILSEFYSWDSALRNNQYTGRIVVSDDQYITIDSIYNLTLENKPITLYKFFVNYSVPSGGELSTMGIHSTEYGTIFYRPWDSHSVIRLNRAISQLEGKTETVEFSALNTLIDNSVLPKYVPPAVDEDSEEEIKGEIVLDLEGNVE